MSLRKRVEVLKQEYGGRTVRAAGPLNDIVTLLRALDETEAERDSLRLGLRDIGVDIAEFGIDDPAYVVRRAAEKIDRLKVK